MTRASLLLALVLLPAPGAAVQEGVTSVRRRDFHGMPCLACPKTIDGPGLELLYRGRRVRLHEGACARAWDRDPELLFASLQPRGALFQEPPDVPRSLASGWFWAGSYVLAGLLSAALCGYLAVARGLRPQRYFALGLALNVAAVGILLLRARGRETGPQGIPTGLRKVPTTRAPVPCRECGRDNHPAASACSSCGGSLTPQVASEIR